MHTHGTAVGSARHCLALLPCKYDRSPLAPMVAWGRQGVPILQLTRGHDDAATVFLIMALWCAQPHNIIIAVFYVKNSFALSAGFSGIRRQLMN